MLSMKEKDGKKTSACESSLDASKGATEGMSSDTTDCGGADLTSEFETISSNQAKKSIIPFWVQDPNVLFRAPFDFFPMPEMTLEQQLNALTRGILIVTAFSFFYSHNTRLPIICVMLLVAIFLYYWAYKRQEGFLQTKKEAVDRFNKLDKNQVFQPATPVNPLSNVLVSDWIDNPHKKPAPPSDRNADNILTQAKKMVVQNNPGQPDIAEKLFADLANELEFEQSMRPFYSTAASTIPNDQGAFAEFCYGSMVSCKEGNMFACARDNPQYRNQ